MRTTVLKEIKGFDISDTVKTQNSISFGEDNESLNKDDVMPKWPRKVKFRNKVYAKIYKPCKGRISYRVAWSAGGKRQMKSFATYSGDEGAKIYADNLVKQLAQQSPIALLTTAQASAAAAAFKLLDDFRVATGRHLSLTTAISEFCQAAKKLNGHTLVEAAAGFMQTAVNVIPKPLDKAVEDFIALIEPLTRSADGKRPQKSSKHVYNLAIQLNRFGGTLKGHAVCDLSKEHLDHFFATLGEQKSKSRNKRKITSAKSRNHYRAAIRQFLDWCVRKDYLSPVHRLFEADTMRAELANTAETEFYTPNEFSALMATAKGDYLPLRPLLAIGGLAGLRTAELLRLDWANVWRVEGHIEVTTGTAKTRARRLVEVCPALALWLETEKKNKSGKLWDKHEVTFHQNLNALCKSAKVESKPVTRKNNALRHSFCSYHLAKYSNENYTAAQSGNSPAMIHRHYKGLATKKEGENFFSVFPNQSNRTTTEPQNAQ
jgi:integrase